MIKKTKPKVVVSVRVDKSVVDRLKKLKINVSRTVSDYLRSMVEGE